MTCEREIIATVIHEFGHVLHLGHCNVWNCLINFSYEYGDFKKVNF